MPGPIRRGIRSLLAALRSRSGLVRTSAFVAVLFLGVALALYCVDWHARNSARSLHAPSLSPLQLHSSLTHRYAAAMGATKAAIVSNAITQSQTLGPEFARAMQLALKLQMDPRRDDRAELEVSTLAHRLKKAELSELASVTLDEAIDGNRRDAALLILTSARENALEQLMDVAAHPMHAFLDEATAHSRGAFQKKFEVSLRVRALEELDRLSTSDSPAIKAESANLIARVVAQQNQPTVQFLAQMSLQGVRTERPGKLKRFIDQIFSGEK